MNQRKLNTLVNNKDIADFSVSLEKISGIFKDLITHYTSSLPLNVSAVSRRERRYNRPAYTEDIENGVVSEEKLSTSLVQALRTIETSLNISSTSTNLNSRPRKNNTVAYNSDLVDGSVSLEKLSYSLRQRIATIATVVPLSLTQYPTGSITLGTPVSITPVFFTTGTASITGTGPRPSPLSIVNNMPISLTSSITTTGTFTYTLTVTEQNATAPRTSNEVSITVTSPLSLTQYPTGSITLGTPVSITPVFFTTGTASITGTGPRPSPLSIVNNMPISLTSSITTTGTFTYTLTVTDQNATVPRTSNEVSITVTEAAFSLTPSSTGSITLGTPVSITPVFFTYGTVSINGTGLPTSSIVSNVSIPLTITSPGTYSYTLTVYDPNGTTRTREASITVTAAALSLTPSSTNIYAGDPVSITPVFFTYGTVSITGFGLPTSLSIASTVSIPLTITINDPGTYSYILTVYDPNGTTRTIDTSITAVLPS